MGVQIWVRTVERQYRLRLPEDAVAAIPWLDANQNKICVGFIGASGQLQIAPEAPETSAAKRMIASLGTSPAEPNDASTRWADFARFAATQWPTKFLVESGRKRVTLVLPKESRNLDLVPGQGTSVVLFVSGSIVEIWKGPEWVAHMRRLRAHLDELVGEATDELDERDL